MLHVLIVEDELAIAETLIYACKEAGIANTHKLLGHEGVTAVREQTFDFVILDVGLPDMAGFDVCKQMLCEPYGYGLTESFYTNLS